MSKFEHIILNGLWHCCNFNSLKLVLNNKYIEKLTCERLKIEFISVHYFPIHITIGQYMDVRTLQTFCYVGRTLILERCYGNQN